MQKTVFLLSQNDENQSENGSKNSKIRLRARPPAEPQKKMLQTKKLRSKKLKNTGFLHFSLADFGRARSRTGVFRTVFLQCFWRRASRPIKNRRFWPNNGHPPPGKPVTFYECHPTITPQHLRCGRIFRGLKQIEHQKTLETTSPTTHIRPRSWSNLPCRWRQVIPHASADEPSCQLSAADSKRSPHGLEGHEVREAVAGCNACDGMCFCFFWKHHKTFRKWRQKWGDVDAGPKDGKNPRGKSSEWSKLSAVNSLRSVTKNQRVNWSMLNCVIHWYDTPFKIKRCIIIFPIEHLDKLWRMRNSWVFAAQLPFFLSQ